MWFERLITRICVWLYVFFVGAYIFVPDARALDILIYHNNYAYTDTKSGLEAQGHTVTGSTSTTVASASTLANYDVVIDQLYNNNCGSTCRANYDTYVKDGGHLIIVGENSNFPGRNGNIESLIENKFGGTLDLSSDVYGGEYYTNGTNNTVNTSVSGADDGGQYIAGSSIATTSDGLWLAKTSGGAIIWMMWRGDDLPSGYTGSVTVTFDINQFQSSYDSDATFEYVDDVMYYGENGTMATPAYSSSIRSAQQTTVTNTRNITSSGNAVYINQVGDNLDLDIVQYDNDNLVAGVSTTSNTISDAVISGDDNTISITQGNSAGSVSDNNVVLLGVNGTNNNLTVRQGDNVDDVGEARLILDVTGNYNTVGILQENDGMGVGDEGHFMSVDIDGNSNIMYMDQKDDGDKIMFVDINGSSNDIDLLQQGTGEHFLDVTAGSNQTINVNQDGSGNMSATIDMSGYTSGLDLDQTGTSNQTYSLTQNCVNSSGCGTTTVTQQ